MSEPVSSQEFRDRLLRWLYDKTGGNLLQFADVKDFNPQVGWTFNDAYGQLIYLSKRGLIDFTGDGLVRLEPAGIDMIESESSRDLPLAHVTNNIIFAPGAGSLIAQQGNSASSLEAAVQPENRADAERSAARQSVLAELGRNVALLGDYRARLNHRGMSGVRFSKSPLEALSPPIFSFGAFDRHAGTLAGAFAAAEVELLHNTYSLLRNLPGRRDEIIMLTEQLREGTQQRQDLVRRNIVNSSMHAGLDRAESKLRQQQGLALVRFSKDCQDVLDASGRLLSRK